MISSALASFINAQAELTALGITAFAKNPDTVLSEIPDPKCLISTVAERAQDLWVIGDAQRKENPMIQAAFTMTSSDGRRQAEARFRRLIESAKATDVGGLIHPGIDFIAAADLLRDSGDHQTYFSDQPGWFTTPVPTIYKNEDGNGEPVVVASGFTIDYANGKVIFSAPNAPTDRIRASFKMGVIDFIVAGVGHFETHQESDVANLPERYVVTFTLEPWFYIKTNPNRWL